MLWQGQVHSLFAILFILAVATGQYCHQCPLHTETGLDNVRHKFRIRPLDGILHTLAAGTLNVHQVKISPVGNAHQLLTTNRIIILNVDRLFAVMCPILCRHIELMNVLLFQAQFCQERMCAGEQFIKRLLPILRIDKIFNLHLLKLAAAEDEIARRNLIAKRLTLLSDAKRQIRIETIDDVFEISEDALGSFWAKVRNRLWIIGNRLRTIKTALVVSTLHWLTNSQLILPTSADKRFEHHIKRP